jgi:hypothetical protein
MMEAFSLVLFFGAALAALAFLAVVVLLVLALVWIRGLSQRVEALEGAARRSSTPATAPDDVRIQR